MLTTERAVLIRYTRDGQPRRGSGLRVGDQFVLTAAHCTMGADHKVVIGGQEYVAELHVRSANPAVDMGVMLAPELSAVDSLRCAYVDRAVSTRLTGCQALGFPVWKGNPGHPRLAQVSGYVPTAEGLNPYEASVPGRLLTLKITDPEAQGQPVPAGDLDDRLWAGMSGAVVTTDDFIIGVVRSHNLAEGARSLTVTPVDAIASLPEDEATQFWAALGVDDPRALPVLPLSATSAVASPDQPITGLTRKQRPYDIGRDDPSPERFYKTTER